MDLFKYLSEIEPSFPEKIGKYILNGECSDILLTLKSLTSDQLEFAGLNLSNIVNGYKYNEGIREKENSIIFKDLLLSDILIEPVVGKRFCIVVCLFNGNVVYTNFDCKDTPRWVKTLHSLVNKITKYDHSNKYLYTGNWFFKVLEENDIPLKISLSLILNPQYTNKKNLENKAHIFNTLDWKKYIIQEDIYLSLVDLNKQSKIFLIDYIPKLIDLNKNVNLIIKFLTDDDALVREISVCLISQENINEIIDVLLSKFDSYPAEIKKGFSVLIVSLDNDEVIIRFSKIIKLEKLKSVKNHALNLISNREASKEKTKELVLPPIPSFPKIKPIKETTAIRLINAVNVVIKERKNDIKVEEIRNKKFGWDTKYTQCLYDDVKDISESEIRKFLECIESGVEDLDENILSILIKSEIMTTNELSIEYIFRIMKNKRHFDLNGGFFKKWLKSNPNQLLDLRQLVPLFNEAGMSLDGIANPYLHKDRDSIEELPNIEGVNYWPFFAEHPEFLSYTFETYYSELGWFSDYSIPRAMLMVLEFPSIPEAFIQIIYAISLSSTNSLGTLARSTLNQYGLVNERVVKALYSDKQDERIIAANWLGDIQCEDAIQTLKSVLKKETKETVKASMLSALHSIGEPIDEYLSSEILLSEAQEGLNKTIHKSIEWFPFDSIPKLKWNTGEDVEPCILKWWIVLSFKLKQPEGNPLISLYIDRLDVESKEILGNYIFHIFIDKDTKCPSDEEAKEYALKGQQSLFKHYKYRAGLESGERFKNKTIENAFNELYKSKKSEFLGSAISAKGILCLGSYIKAEVAIPLLSSYMKENYKRRHQIEALLTVFSNNNEPIAIQFLLSVARGNRTNIIKEKATSLIEVIAERNGWTQDELADRTIPTAGFELDGEQVLELGSRIITVNLTEKLKIVIMNETGKVIKSLPPVKEDDDLVQFKEVKKQFSNIKKELKQVLDFQINRFYESMCTNRVWPYNEWYKYILQHPILTHVVQKLIWVASINSTDTFFRPTAEGELIDINDNEVEIQNNSTIQLAYAGMLDESLIKAWTKILKEEKITQPFKQLTSPNHELSNTDFESNKLDYHLGWVTDTFVIRSVLTKLGYKHGEPEDGSFFNHYYKDFSSLNLRLTISFSGNNLPEDKMPAIIYHIAFVKPSKRGWVDERNYIKINDIPRSILVEAMKDYEAIAKKASYDESWESMSPW